MNARISHLSARSLWTLLVIAGVALACGSAIAASLDAAAISKAAGTKATIQKDGVVKIGWSAQRRAGHGGRHAAAAVRRPGVLGRVHHRWARAMVMGDTVVFQDEVTPAMDAAFAHGLE